MRILEEIEDPAGLHTFLKEHPQLQIPAIVETLHSEILSGIVVNTRRARRLSKVARWLAEVSPDEYTVGLADRCDGHVQYASSNYPAAVRYYESAAQRFEHIGREADVARTLTGAMQSLIYLGLDDKALQFAERARVIFEHEGDELRLARLDSNVGNIFYRQDRYLEARRFYQGAFARLITLNRNQDGAAVLSNMAVASTGMGEFEQAAREYAHARKIADAEGLRSLAAELDYNVAYLHFLRGDHTRALVLYREARRHSDDAGDEYHAALCDLDQAEVYLDLNLIDESVDLSCRAASRFEQLGMNYERAKALTFSGLGEHLRHNIQRALFFFSKARRLFVEAHNPVWPAVVDYCRSVLLRDLGQTRPALKLAKRAERVFESERLPHRSALARLLIASIWFDRHQIDRALNCAAAATTGLDSADHPMLFFYGQYLEGRILQAAENKRAALSAFLRAAELLETVRCRLAADELKVAFVRNKLDVYSQLLRLTYDLEPVQERATAIFELIEKSKSRSLADRIAFLQTNPGEPTQPQSEFRRTREKLNAIYREIDSRESERRDVRKLRNQAASLERHLAEQLRDDSLGQEIPSGTVDWKPVRLEAVAAKLPAQAQIIEFFVTDRQLWVGIIGKDGADFKNLGPLDPVYSSLKLFNFQISRFQHYKAGFADQLGQAATLAHLQALYQLLIKPIESSFQGNDLVILPHGLLHQLPFHALHDGSGYLIERSTVSYAPSATIFCLCEGKAGRARDRSLLVGMPDEKSSAIEDEIQSIAALLPEPLVFLHRQATADAVFEHGKECRYIHIAAHSRFRKDNPMFSSVRLADSQVNVLDLYRLRLNADLVTLSGCSTGASTVVGGDELVGLARGLMHAGARAVLLALWDVHDSTTATLMRYFYENLVSGTSCAAALRTAMLQLKGERPEPYYWAPFAVSGYALAPQCINFSRPYISR